MHSYVDWLRETYLCDENTFVQGLSETFKKYRADVTAKLYTRCESFHTRFPDTLAHLMIGFEYDNCYYLIMNAAISEVVKLSKEMGDSFSIGKNNLIQQLVDDGIMVVKGKRNTTTVRVNDDRQMSVAVLDKSKMLPDEGSTESS